MISDIAFAGSSAADDEVDFCVKTLQYSSVIIAVLIGASTLIQIIFCTPYD